ncbi:hypothetical protein Tco_1124931 [Tanacetum coccineum]|uniref:Uncharacterized protein n=1 Tax=Tanacetum coccineum TaxID=301880 RepID=A0ABQ5J7I7_9ASTR
MSFLHGTLKEDVYVCQPEGFIDADHPSHVIQVRALYGVISKHHEGLKLGDDLSSPKTLPVDDSIFGSSPVMRSVISKELETLAWETCRGVAMGLEGLVRGAVGLVWDFCGFRYIVDWGGGGVVCGYWGYSGGVGCTSIVLREGGRERSGEEELRRGVEGRVQGGMGWGERKESDRGYCGESEKARVWSVGDEEGGWRGVDAVKGGVKRTKPRGGGNRGGARGSSDTWRIVAQRVASAIETIAIYESKTSVPRNSRNRVKRQEDKVEENASNIGHGKVTMVEVLASNKTKDIK